MQITDASMEQAAAPNAGVILSIHLPSLFTKRKPILGEESGAFWKILTF